jgi:hypothetical protein
VCVCHKDKDEDEGKYSGENITIESRKREEKR